jgi:hypothetical protein
MAEQQAAYGETLTAPAYQQNVPCQKHQPKLSWPRRVAEGTNLAGSDARWFGWSAAETKPAVVRLKLVWSVRPDSFVIVALWSEMECSGRLAE